MNETQQTIVSKLLQFISEECTAVDVDSAYDEMLDECYSFKPVGGPFDWMQPSKVLKEMDNTAYRCGKNDWTDSQEYIEVGNEYYQGDDVREAQEKFVDDLDNQGTDLENEITELEAEEDPNLQEVAKLKQRLYELQAEMTEAKNYSF